VDNNKNSDNLFLKVEFMPRFSRTLYQNAVEKVLDKYNFKTKELSLAKLLAVKDSRLIYIDVAGKNFPYKGGNDEDAFLWETHIKPERLTKIEREAKNHAAEPWIAFSYIILNQKYEQNFKVLVHIADKVFGVKFIDTAKFGANKQPRSPAWEAIELPRKLVAKLTIEADEL
jgi:hypothetical protein